MSENGNEAKEGYYYCEKCNSIPLIHILSIKDSLKLFCVCKCTKNLFTYVSFHKLYFHLNLY